jgi:hypothetical protein
MVAIVLRGRHGAHTRCYTSAALLARARSTHAHPPPRRAHACMSGTATTHAHLCGSQHLGRGGACRHPQAGPAAADATQQLNARHLDLQLRWQRLTSVVSLVRASTASCAGARRVVAAPCLHGWLHSR